MLNGIFQKGLLISVLAIFFANVSIASEYTPNAFKVPPSNGEAAPQIKRSMNTASLQNQLQAQQLNQVNNPTNEGLSNVNKALVDKEERSQKILDQVNKKMLKSKNVPVENSRYIGIINGKRVYQDNVTLEYVKVELDK
jgi:hypothetical protein